MIDLLPLSVRRFIWGIVGDVINVMVEMEAQQQGRKKR